MESFSTILQTVLAPAQKNSWGVASTPPPDRARVNPRPAGPSPDPTLCWGGGGRIGPPSISETNRRRGKIQTAMERPGRDLSEKV